VIYLSKLSHRLAQLYALGLVATLAACNLPAPQPNSVDGLDPESPVTPTDPPDETIPLRASTHTCDNQPSGYTKAFESGMDQLPLKAPAASSDGFSYYDNQITTLSVQQSSSAPMSPSSVLRVLYPRGFRGGSAPSRWSTKPLPSNTGSIYTCLWARFSQNWTSNGNVGTKLYFVRGANTTNHVVVAEAGSNWLHAYIYTALQFGTGGPISSNVGQIESPANDISGGGWHKIEVLWGANTPGQKDGDYLQWIDGVQIAERHDVEWFAPGQVPEWTYIWFDPTYGGGTHIVPHDEFIEFDHFYAAVK
jgi:hypothetical protein